MNGYTIPKPYSTMCADDGGVFVVGDRGYADGRLATSDAALILAAYYGHDVQSAKMASGVADRGEHVMLHRCLASDDIGEEAGWWHPDGSGVALPCVYFPREVVEELNPF